MIRCLPPLAVALVAAASLASYAADKPASAAASGDCHLVKITTSMGPITVALDAAKAPVTVDNFVGYVKSGQYDGTIFHRVIDGFMIQGGGFTPDMHQKPTKPPIPIESKNGLSNAPYTIAMARTSDPDSATAQFFINVADNAKLDYAGDMNPGYTVFGKVVSGRETVDKIRNVPTGNKGMFQNVPTQQVTIEKAQCVAEGKK
ncbi:MAG TPA: peptidylprolyl isomerase [Usitatibacter sp.]|jgi:peptidyl-prolyl cis-trans isomerase A (cyclophilin A)|nr:peptidylprolyl isomerase [Usitatibacter sp.]